MPPSPSLDDMTRTGIEELFTRADAGILSGTSQLVPAPLLALYTIWREKGKLDGLRVALLGDLNSDKQAQALARLLGRFETRLSFVSPAALSMPPEVSDELRASGLEVEETNDLLRTLAKVDVLYLVRLDPERIPPNVYARFKDYYKFTPASFQNARPDLLVLGDWRGAEELLVPGRARSKEYERALVAAF